MRILLDHGVPAPLREFLRDHTVATAYEMGWANLRYQQNLAGRRLAVLVLPTTSWPRIQAHIAEVVEAVSRLRPGELRELTFRA